MEDNLNNLNIDDFLGKMNSPEMADTIKNLINSISNSSNESSETSSETSFENTFDLSYLISSLSHSINSSKLDLLTALKPYVNKKRQKKIDQCEKFVSMINTFSLINNLTKDEDT